MSQLRNQNQILSRSLSQSQSMSKNPNRNRDLSQNQCQHLAFQLVYVARTHGATKINSMLGAAIRAAREVAHFRFAKSRLIWLSSPQGGIFESQNVVSHRPVLRC